ncbi:MAG: hypothetical protein DRR11_12475 [Gammaproteobacteria bacterium]|nr:MAG: hypothetical protein DRR11_12475 [Gammaproteobacteria bacterium]RLA34155.1 MAG: hypothetical protein DRR15_09430 [Gammaproteobacteria bacterium]
MFTYSTRTAAKTAATLLAAIMAIGGSTIVNAQGETDEQLLVCDRIADTAEKMACFDAVIKSLKQAGDAPVVESASVIAPATNTPAAIAPAAAVGATAAATPASVPEPEPAADVQSSPPTDTPVEPAAASTPSATPTDAPAEATVTSATAAEEFGFDKKKGKTAEQKEADKNAELKSLQATIVRSWGISDERFAVQLDNGQVWHENGGLYIGLPKEGSSVEIARGRFGGYSMKVGNVNKRTPVRRAK